jgi:hypothetical protein
LFERRFNGTRLAEDPSQIAFLYPSSSKLPRFIAFSQHEGTHVEMYDLANLAEPCFRFELRASASFMHRDQSDLLGLFGHMAYLSSIETLLVSHSARASVFALHLRFGDDEEGLEGCSDADYFSRLQGSPPKSSVKVQADHVIELPSPEPIIGFAADDVTAPQEISLFVVHPERINEIHIEKSSLLPPSHALLSDPVPLVDAEQQQQQQPPPPPTEATRNVGPPASSPAVVPSVPAPTTENVNAAPPAVVESTTTTTTTKKSKGKASSKPAQQQIDKSAGVPAGGPVNGDDGGDAPSMSAGAVTREIKRLEDGLYKRMSALIQKEIERQGQCSVGFLLGFMRM